MSFSTPFFWQIARWAVGSEIDCHIQVLEVHRSERELISHNMSFSKLSFCQKGNSLIKGIINQKY